LKSLKENFTRREKQNKLKGSFRNVTYYGRTVLKLLMGKGPLATRLIPDYTAPLTVSIFQRLLNFLNRTHIYLGIATIAVVLLHIILVGGLMNNLFFPAILILIIWQAFFGLFISWKFSPKEVKTLWTFTNR
jgi:hypothetical protein